MKKKKKNHNRLVLLGKGKLNIIQFLISKTLISWYISHDEFVNNGLREYYEMKEGIKNPSVEYII